MTKSRPNPHPSARYVVHLRGVLARSFDTLEQIRTVLVRTTAPPVQVQVALLETIGSLHQEVTVWRRRLAVAAVEEGMSQRAVAEAMKVSRRTVQTWLAESRLEET